MSRSAVKTVDRPVEAAPNGAYQALLGGIARVIDDAGRVASRFVNAAMAAYWLIGRHIVEFEQDGQERGEYGRGVVERLAADLSARHGRGFSARNLWQMGAFYVAWPVLQLERSQALAPMAAKLRTPSAESGVRGTIVRFSRRRLENSSRQPDRQFARRCLANSRPSRSFARNAHRSQAAG